MRELTFSVDALSRTVIRTGFVGENEHTRIIFDATSVFDEYPRAVPSLAVAPPVGAPYPAIISRDGNLVIWDIVNSNLTTTGYGEAQLTFTQDNVVCKSYITRIIIDRSIEASGEAPDPIADWIAEANTALNAIPQTIDNALQDAKDSGEFDGFSPTVSATPTAGGHDVTITDAEGDHTFSVENGEPGADGYSPSASVTKSGDASTITITDKDGTTSAEVLDGKDGQPGAPGKDGYSPTASVSKVGHVATITITDRNGTTTAQVSDGADGTDIIDDTAGVGDTNKVWSANKSATEAETLDAKIDNTVAIQDTQPTSADNKLWVNTANSPSEVQVPSYTEFTNLSSAINVKYEKPSGGIPASDLAEGVIPSVPVTDVQINGTSILDAQGVADVPITSAQSPGVMRIGADYGITLSGTRAVLSKATDAQIKAGEQTYKPIVASNQHLSTFYALAKAAGSDMASLSGVTLGVYPESQKVAIQKMLGIYQAPWELIREDTVTNATEADIDITVDSNGQPFRLTDVEIIIWFEQQTPNPIIGDYGRVHFMKGNSIIRTAYLTPSGQVLTPTDKRVAMAQVLREKSHLTVKYVEYIANASHPAIKVTSNTNDDNAGTPFGLTTNDYFDLIKIKAITGTANFRVLGKRKWD